MLVRQILAMKGGADVVTIGAETSVQDTAQLLSEKKIGAVIVSSGNDIPEGIVSERDIVRELGRRGPSCLSDTVADLMTRNLVGTTLDQTTDQVLQKMTDGRFRHMPVLEGERMVGLVSIGDVVKARLSELSMEKDALEGMIKGF